MALIFNDGVMVNAPLPVEGKYLNGNSQPYADTTEVLAAIPITKRYIGLTVNIDNVEYWFKGGVADSNLVKKTTDLSTTALTGATNGLYVDNQVVKLGSGLTENTTISNLNTYDLIFSGGSVCYGDTYHNDYTSLSIPDVGYVTGLTSGKLDCSDFTAYTATTDTRLDSIETNVSGNTQKIDDLSGKTANSFCVAGNALSCNGRTIDWGGEMCCNTIINGTTNNNYTVDYQNVGQFNVCFNTSSTLTDNSSEKHGIEYAACYHDTYTNRSLVDAEYVTGKTSQLQPSISGNKHEVIVHDGTNPVGEPNFIYDDVNDNLFTNFGNITSGTTRSTILSSDNVTNAGAVNSAIIGSTRAKATGSTYNNTLSVDELALWNIQGTGNLVLFDEQNKKLCLSELSSIGGLSGATNGLGVDGQNVCMGGPLIKNTTISGSGYTMTYDEMNGFTVRTINGNDMCFDGRQSGGIYLRSQTGETASGWIGSVGISVDFDNGFKIFDNRIGDVANSQYKGIEYDDNYHQYYSNRSLVDKEYVNTIATGLQPKSSAWVATTGQTTLSGLGIVDGIQLQNGDRVLVKDQSNPVDNGIYIASASTWQRSEDFDGTPEGEVAQGALIPVISGNTNADTAWILTTEDDDIEVGTDPLNFALFSRLLNIQEGNGIEISTVNAQKTISVKTTDTGSGLLVDSLGLRVNSLIAGKGLTFDNTTTGILNAGVVSGSCETGDIKVYYDPNNNEDYFIDCNDIKTVVGSSLTQSCNGLSDSNGVVCLGGDLCVNTTIAGDSSYSMTMSGLTHFYLGFGGQSLITDTRNVNNTAGLEYAGDYEDGFGVRTLITKQYADNCLSTAISGETLQQVTDRGCTTTNSMIIGNATSGAGNYYNLVVGCNNIVSGSSSLASGRDNIVYSDISHAEGIGVKIHGDYSHAEGFYTVVSGLSAHAEGYKTLAIGGNSHVEGCYTVTTGTNSHAEGFYTGAVGFASHAEGDHTTSNGDYSHAEGWNTNSLGERSHAEGELTTSSGCSSHAEGYNTTSIGHYSHAQGYGTKACASASFAAGRFNVGNSSSIFEIGVGGSDTERCDTLDINVDGTICMPLLPTASTSYVMYVDNTTGKLSFNEVPVGDINAADNGLTKVGNTVILGGDNALTGNTLICSDYHGLAFGSSHVTASGDSSFAVGAHLNNGKIISSGIGSFALGCADSGSILADGNSSIAFGSASAGGVVKTTSNSSLAFGQATVVGTEIVSSGIGSIAFGLPKLNYNKITASGDGSFAGGIANFGSVKASGSASFAFGQNVEAISNQSIALGSGVVASGETAKTSIGKYNISCTGNIFEIGIGADFNTRKNAFEVTTDGYVKLPVSPQTGDSATDNVLVWDSADKEIKQISSETLGEDNNIYSITSVTSNYTVQLTDYVILVDSTAGDITISLPDKTNVSIPKGQAYKIKDIGDAFNNNITIDGGVTNIDDARQAFINTQFGALEVVYDGVNNWYTLAFIN